MYTEDKIIWWENVKYLVKKFYNKVLQVNTEK